MLNTRRQAALRYYQEGELTRSEAKRVFCRIRNWNGYHTRWAAMARRLADWPLWARRMFLDERDGIKPLSFVVKEVDREAGRVVLALKEPTT